MFRKFRRVCTTNTDGNMCQLMPKTWIHLDFYFGSRSMFTPRELLRGGPPNYGLAGFIALFSHQVKQTRHSEKRKNYQSTVWTVEYFTFHVFVAFCKISKHSLQVLQYKLYIMHFVLILQLLKITKFDFNFTEL